MACGHIELLTGLGRGSIQLVQISLIGDSAIEARAVDAHAARDLAQRFPVLEAEAISSNFDMKVDTVLIEFVLAACIGQHKMTASTEFRTNAGKRFSACPPRHKFSLSFGRSCAWKSIQWLQVGEE